MIYPVSFWIGFHLVVFFLLFLDLFVFNKNAHKPSIKSSVLWSVFWISVAFLFNAFIYFSSGPGDALTFFTGYIIEKSLSVDNIFVFLLVFSSLKIRAEHQRKILYWGIFGALVLRLSLILLGVSILEKYSWMYYVFGAFLCITGVRFLFDTQEEKGLESNPVYKLAKKVLPLDADNLTSDFFIKKSGKIFFTASFLALLLIETADLVFALDSIPAILAITTNPFLVYTSNVFAMLGLRSLYFVIAYFQDKLCYFSFGLAFILVFIGVKMIITHWIVIGVGMSLGVIAAALIITIAASICFPKKKD